MIEWKEYRLGDVAEVLGGFAFKSTEFGEVGYPVVKIKDIVPPIVAVESCERVNVSAYDTQRIEKYKLKRGDYLVAMTGATVGKVGRNDCVNTRCIDNRGESGVPRNDIAARSCRP